MKIRVYYKDNGEIVGIVIEGEKQWNVLELTNRNCQGYEQIEFDLTEENLEKYMENPHEVNLDIIEQERFEEAVDNFPDN